MRDLKTFLFTLLMSALLVACNTVHGAGEDISAGGQAVSHAATDVQQKM